MRVPGKTCPLAALVMPVRPQDGGPTVSATRSVRACPQQAPASISDANALKTFTPEVSVPGDEKGIKRMSSRNLHVTLPKGVEEDIVLFFSPDDLDSGPMTFWES